MNKKLDNLKSNEYNWYIYSYIKRTDANQRLTEAPYDAEFFYSQLQMYSSPKRCI